MTEVIGMDDARAAAWLNAHPDFFLHHPETLGGMRFPDPRGDADTVSLAGYQLQEMRQKLAAQHEVLGSLMHNASLNDELVARLVAFAGALLKEPAAAHLPDLVVRGLRQYFAVPFAAIRVWGVDASYAGLACAQALTAEQSECVRHLGAPLVGQLPAPLLALLGDDAASARSHACLPLAGSGTQLGVLVLGSPDPDRFDPQADTVFLLRLSAIAASAILRLSLAGPATPWPQTPTHGPLDA